MESNSVGVEDLAKSLTTLTKAMETILKKAQGFAQESVDVFLSDKVSCLGELIGLYNKCFESLNVESREDVDKLCEKNFKHKIIQEEFEFLNETEDDWNKFVHGIDDKMKNAGDKKTLKEGDLGPLSIPLQEVEGTKSSEFDALNGRVIVVAFGAREKAKSWLEETKCTFEMVVDAERDLYCAVGLRRSLAKVWNTSTLSYYATQMRQGKKLIKGWEGDDPMQMGGDFMVDKNGKMLLVYCSQAAHDRPSIDTLLQILKQQKDDAEDDQPPVKKSKTMS